MLPAGVLLGFVYNLLKPVYPLIADIAVNLAYDSQRPLLQGAFVIVAGLAITVLVVFLSPLASSFADGLEWVAEEQAFLDTARNAPFELLPDYTLPLLGETGLSTIAAGLIGTLVVAAVTYAVVRILRRPQPKRAEVRNNP